MSSHFLWPLPPSKFPIPALLSLWLSVPSLMVRIPLRNSQQQEWENGIEQGTELYWRCKPLSDAVRHTSCTHTHNMLFTRSFCNVTGRYDRERERQMDAGLDVAPLWWAEREVTIQTTQNHTGFTPQYIADWKQLSVFVSLHLPIFFVPLALYCRCLFRSLYPALSLFLCSVHLVHPCRIIWAVKS